MRRNLKYIKLFEGFNTFNKLEALQIYMTERKTHKSLACVM